MGDAALGLSPGLLHEPGEVCGAEQPGAGTGPREPSPGTPLPFLGNSAASSSQRPSAGQAVEHRRGARTRGCEHSPERILNRSF